MDNFSEPQHRLLGGLRPLPARSRTRSPTHPAYPQNERAKRAMFGATHTGRRNPGLAKKTTARVGRGHPDFPGTSKFNRPDRRSRAEEGDLEFGEGSVHAAMRKPPIELPGRPGMGWGGSERGAPPAFARGPDAARCPRAPPSGRANRTRAPAGRPPFSVAGGGAAGEAPIFCIEAAAHQPPLGDRFYFPESRDAGGASAEPGREGGEVAAGGNDPEFLIRVPLGA